VVFRLVVGLADATVAPVPQGRITTVRAASPVGTITARVPGTIVLTVVVLLLAMMSATIRIASSATITTQTERLAAGSASVRVSSASSVSCTSAIGLLP
jgi:hypothetical protein